MGRAFNNTASNPTGETFVESKVEESGEEEPSGGVSAHIEIVEQSGPVEVEVEVEAESEEKTSSSSASASASAFPRLTTEGRQQLFAAVRSLLEVQKRVMYADCGVALEQAVAFIDTEAAQDFVDECLYGIVDIFLQQRATMVKKELLIHFEKVLKGAVDVCLWDLQNNRSLHHLEALMRVFHDKEWFYSDSVDANPFGMDFGAASRHRMLDAFAQKNGWTVLLHILEGRILVQDRAAADSPRSESEKPALSGHELYLILSTIAAAQAKLRAENEEYLLCASELVMRHLGEMKEEDLKKEKSEELSRIHDSLAAILGENNKVLRRFLMELALKTLKAQAFPLKKLGLDLICQFTNSTDKFDRGFNSNSSYNQIKVNAYPRGYRSGAINVEGGNNEEQEAEKSEELKSWLLENNVVETLFSSDEFCHPVLLGRSKDLLYYMMRVDALKDSHIDLMFKSSMKQHESVRGAIQALLAELVVDKEAPDNITSYILNCARRLSLEGSGANTYFEDVLFFTEKLAKAEQQMGNLHYFSQMKPRTLRALVELLFVLVHGFRQLDDPKRRQVMEYLVQVLRSRNTSSEMREEYVTRCLRALEESRQNASVKSKLRTRVFNAYELLRRIIEMNQVNSYGSGMNLHGSSRNDNQLQGHQQGQSSNQHEGGDSVRILKAGASQTEIVENLEKENGVLELVIDETCQYARSMAEESSNKELWVLYMKTLRTRLEFLRFCLERSHLMLSFELINELWTTLRSPDERELLMVWLRKTAWVESGLEPGISADVAKRVFSSLLCDRTEFTTFSEHGFRCFSAFFLDVNRDELELRHIKQHQQQAPSNATGSNPQEEEEAAEGSEYPADKSRKKASLFTFGFGRTKKAEAEKKPPAPVTTASSAAQSATVAKEADKEKASEKGKEGKERPEEEERREMVGLETLWMIVVSAPQATSHRAMKLLLQVQCKLEAETLFISREQSLARRKEFLDKIFHLLGSLGGEGKKVVSAETKVRRCIQLLRNYLDIFPLPSRHRPHKMPTGPTMHLTIHHNLVLLFSKADIGKVVQQFSHPRMRHDSGYHLVSQGIIIDYNAEDGRHEICFENGKKLCQDMRELQFHTGNGASTATSYKLVKHPHLSSPVQSNQAHAQGQGQAQGQTRWPQEILEHYRPATIQCKGSMTLKELRFLVLSLLGQQNRDTAVLTDANMVLDAHLPMPASSPSSSPRGSPAAAPFAQEHVRRISVFPANKTLQEMLSPTYEGSAGRAERHTIYVSWDAGEEGKAGEADERGAYVQFVQDADLPAFLICKEGSSYAAQLLSLLKSKLLVDEARVELWRLMTELPTDQTSYKRILDPSCDLKAALSAEGGGDQLQSIYLCMIAEQILEKDASEWAPSFAAKGGLDVVIRLLHDLLRLPPSRFTQWQQITGLPVLIHILYFFVIYFPASISSLRMKEEIVAEAANAMVLVHASCTHREKSRRGRSIENRGEEGRTEGSQEVYGYEDEHNGYMSDSYSTANTNTTQSQSQKARLKAAEEADGALQQVMMETLEAAAGMLHASKEHKETLVLGFLAACPSIMEILLFNSYLRVRSAVRQVLIMLCDSSEKSCAVVEGYALKALERVTVRCRTSHDFFQFLTHQLLRGVFNRAAFAERIAVSLIHHPSPSMEQQRREAKLLAGFENGSAYARPVQREEAQDAYKTATANLSDPSLIGQLKLLTGLIEHEPSLATDRSANTLCALAEAILTRYLLTTATAENPDVASIATLPQTREAAFQLLKVLVRSNAGIMLRVTELYTMYIDKTPVPVTRMGRLEWSFKSTDARKAPFGFVGLVNEGATCYQNSVLQQLLMCPRLNHCLLDAIGPVQPLTQRKEDKDALHAPGALLYALQDTLSFLKASQRRCFNPIEFVKETASLKLTDGHLRQNDAIEFYSRLVDYLEVALSEHVGQKQELKELLYVKTCTMNVRACKGKHLTETETGTPFLTLNVRSGMAGPTLHSLDEALESWFKAEKLTGLECETCKKTGEDREDKRYDADQIKCFSKLPPVLVVQLQRFDFDFELMQPTKLNHRVSFEHKVDLGRFTKKAVMDKVFKDKDKADIDLHSNIDMDSMDTLGGTEYELRGVVVHQGSGANFGHYYSFIMDRKSRNWFRFDDERVVPFDPANLEEECFGGVFDPASPSAWQASSGMASPFSKSQKDNNAYLLLYERIKEDTSPAPLPTRPNQSLPTTQRMPLSFPLAARIVVAVQRLKRKGVSRVEARQRREENRRRVWEDNQRTLRHALVLVPDFLDFALSTIQQANMALSQMDERLVTAQLKNSFTVAKMGITTFVKAAIRVASQKDKLEQWLESIVSLMNKNAELVQRTGELEMDVSRWFIWHLSTNEEVVNHWLKPLLLHCPEPHARENFSTLFIHTLKLLASGSQASFLTEPGCIIDVLAELLPRGRSTWKVMDPYFRAWKFICSVEALRVNLLNADILGKFIDLYVSNDPAAPAKNRLRSDDSGADSTGGPHGVGSSGQKASFEPLIHAVSLLVVGEYPGKHCKGREVKMPFGLPLLPTHSKEAFRGEEFYVHLSRRDPGPGAFVLAMRAKSDKTATEGIVKELQGTLRNSRIYQVSYLGLSKESIRDVMVALEALVCVQDDQMVGRTRAIIEFMIKTAIHCKKSLESSDASYIKVSLPVDLEVFA